MENIMRKAYHAGYRAGEVAKETGSLPDMSGVEYIIDGMYEERFSKLADDYFPMYDMVDRDFAQHAYECGLCDGYRGFDPMTNAQIDIHFD